MFKEIPMNNRPKEKKSDLILCVKVNDRNTTLKVVRGRQSQLSFGVTGQMLPAVWTRLANQSRRLNGPIWA
jgi:hypothetical protein